MEVTQFAEKLRTALRLARQEIWDNPTPTTTMQLGILLQRLSNRFPAYWDEEPDMLAGELLTSSHELALRLNEFEPLTLGFAMRTHRYVKGSLEKNA